MVFSSPLFIFYFLPVFLLCYFLSPARLKNLTCLFFSLFFYAWGAPRIIPLLLVSCILDFVISKKLNDKNRKSLLAFGVIYNLSGLIYYKYANFIIGEANGIFDLIGVTNIQWHEVLLPIGISFFTFHKISYLIDVYRGTVEPENSLVDYLLYILLFPQLVAGPIIRYHDVSIYLKSRKHSLHGFAEGLARFCFGFAKKLLIADEAGFVANKIFLLPQEQLTTDAAWIGLLAYTIQIYFDFSAYSDMAIGLGRMIGFKFLENFNQPYLADSITEFWKRWHISLSRWMKDYLYIPLGGNKGSSFRTYLNLWIVFIASGFWHGAQWTFLIWGCFHGLMLVIERAWDRPVNLPKPLRIAWTFTLVMFSWLLFRAESFGQIIFYLKALAFNSQKYDLNWGFIMHNRQIAAITIGLILCFIPYRKFSEKYDLIRYLASIFLFILACCAMMNSNFSPFLYFRF